MKFKLPIVIGSLFILLSFPFIFGLLEPSMHEGGYSALYVILNMPALMVISGAVQKIETAFFKTHDLFTSNMLTLTLVFLFWILSSFVLGCIFDEIKRKQRSRQA